MNTPYNPATGKEFTEKAADQLLAAAHAAGITDPRWATEKQIANELAGQHPSYITVGKFKREERSGIPRLAGVRPGAVAVSVTYHIARENPKTGETVRARKSHTYYNLSQAYGLGHVPLTN